MTATFRSRAARLLPGGIPRWVRCYDNATKEEPYGLTADRYTCVFIGRYTMNTGGEHWALNMSSDPCHPQGVGIHSSDRRQWDAMQRDGGYGWPPAIGCRHWSLGLRIPFEALPCRCRRVVLPDYCYLWSLTEGDVPSWPATVSLFDTMGWPLPVEVTP